MKLKNKVILALLFVVFTASNAMGDNTTSTIKAVWAHSSGFSVMLDNGYFSSQACLFASGVVNTLYVGAEQAQNMLGMVRDAFKAGESLLFVMAPPINNLSCTIEYVIEGNPSPFFQ